MQETQWTEQTWKVTIAFRDERGDDVTVNVTAFHPVAMGALEVISETARRFSVTAPLLHAEAQRCGAMRGIPASLDGGPGGIFAVGSA